MDRSTSQQPIELHTLKRRVEDLADVCREKPGFEETSALLATLAERLSSALADPDSDLPWSSLIPQLRRAAALVPVQGDQMGLRRSLERLGFELAAVRFASGEANLAEQWYSNPDRTATLLRRLPRLVEFVAVSGLGRLFSRMFLGGKKRRTFRRLARPLFRELIAARRPTRPRPEAPVAALFHTCQVDYLEPAVGQACLDTLEAQGVDVVVPSQNCCGLPALQAGDLETAKAQLHRNLEKFLPLVAEGRTIVVASSSCAEMLRVHLPRLLESPEARAAAEAVESWGAYLLRWRQLQSEGLELEAAKNGPIACVLACGEMSRASAELLSEIPAQELVPIEACSGIHDALGLDVKGEKQPFGLLESGLTQIREGNFPTIVSECRHVARSLETALGRKVLHPAEVLQSHLVVPIVPEPQPALDHRHTPDWMTERLLESGPDLSPPDPIVPNSRISELVGPDDPTIQVSRDLRLSEAAGLAEARPSEGPEHDHQSPHREASDAETSVGLSGSENAQPVAPARSGLVELPAPEDTRSADPQTDPSARSAVAPDANPAVDSSSADPDEAEVQRRKAASEAVTLQALEVVLTRESPEDAASKDSLMRGPEAGPSSSS